MNAFFYPLKRGFYFAEIQGGKVTAYISRRPHRPHRHHQPQAHALHNADINRLARIIQPPDVLRLRYGGGTFEIKSCRM